MHNVQDTIHNYLTYEEPGKSQRLARGKVVSWCQPQMTQMLELSDKDFKADSKMML